MTFYYYIDSYLVKDLFATINKPQEIAKVKLKVLECILTHAPMLTIPKKPYMVIEQEKFQRVFLINQDGHQIISFNLDVYCRKCDDPSMSSFAPVLCFFRGLNAPVTTKNVSEALLLLNQYIVRDTNVYGYVCTEIDEPIDTFSYMLLDRVLMSESGYVRYDYDERGYKPGIHPIHHLDVNYSSAVHFKLGLDGRIEEKELSDILNLKTVCAVLNLPSHTILSHKGIAKVVKQTSSNKERKK